jgi:hypothetical protein
MSQFNQHLFFGCPEYVQHLYEAMAAQYAHRQHHTTVHL